MRLKIALSLFLLLMFGPQMTINAAQIYGYVEKISFPDQQLTLSAKLDTGAKSASLHATHITEITKNGIPYLRFVVPTKEKNHVFEGEYKGRVKIKVRADEKGTHLQHEPIRRPVVLLRLQLGNQIKTIKVNLTNRKRFIYPLLLGRDAIIAFNGAIDPALTFTTKQPSNPK